MLWLLLQGSVSRVQWWAETPPTQQKLDQEAVQDRTSHHSTSPPLYCVNEAFKGDDTPPSYTSTSVEMLLHSQYESTFYFPSPLSVNRVQQGAEYLILTTMWSKVMHHFHQKGFSKVKRRVKLLPYCLQWGSGNQCFTSARVVSVGPSKKLNIWPLYYKSTRGHLKKIK